MAVEHFEEESKKLSEYLRYCNHSKKRERLIKRIAQNESRLVLSRSIVDEVRKAVEAPKIESSIKDYTEVKISFELPAENGNVYTGEAVVEKETPTLFQKMKSGLKKFFKKGE